MSTATATTGRLEGKIALVTGSTSGIGEGIARLFASEGASVVLHGRYAEEGPPLLETLLAQGIPAQRLTFRAAELAEVEQAQALVQHAVEIFGGLDILVNNAGDVRRGTLDDTSVEQWDEQLAVNLRAPFVLCQASVPHMRRRGGGSIINIGSVNAYIGAPNLTAYSVSKGGMMTLTKNLAAQLARDHIRVNLLNPGWTLTQGEDRLQRRLTGDEDWIEQALASRPFGRMLLPEDIARAALYFASNDSALVTGTVLDLEQYPVGAPPR